MLINFILKSISYVNLNCKVAKYLISSTFTLQQNSKELRSESSPGMITGRYYILSVYYQLFGIWTLMGF